MASSFAAALELVREGTLDLSQSEAFAPLYDRLIRSTLLLVAVGYGLAALYYLDHNDKLSRLVRIEIIATTCAIVVAVTVSLAVNVVSTVRALLR